MSSAPEPRSSPGDILTLSAKLNRAETVEAAAAHAVELSETALEQPVVSVVSCDPQTDAATVVASSTDGPDAALDRLPESVVTRLNGGDGESPSDGTPDATVNTDPSVPGSAEVFVPVGRRHVLALVTADPNGVDDPDIAAIEGLAANLDAALSRIDAQQSAAVDRDVTRTLSVENGGDREKQQQRLESFQQAVESARDGVAVLDDEEYTYVDGSHVDMYGFDDKEQLLGNTWRELYDDEEVERLEAEAFPALESEGYWRGMVTGSRPDGSTFPAELSLTTVDDGRLVCTVRDETERVERERLARTRTEFLQSVYEVTTDPELTFDEKITELLEAGRDHLDLPYGFLTRIEKGDEDESGTQTIVEALGSHELLQPGESAPLEQSYCRKTIDQDGLVALTHAAEEGWPENLAYETFELETYIGGEVVAGADLYGTLCFASTEPRETEFDEFERSFIRLVARWAGYEIDRRNTREELREQRDRLELTLSGTNTGLAEWDLETDTVTWDETLASIVGRDVDTVEEFREAVHPDDRDRVQRELETMVETGEPWTGEFRMLDPDGDTLWVGTRAMPVYDGDGEPVRVLATGTDVSDRKEREQALEESRERYQTLLQASPDPVFVADTETGDVVEANAAAEEILDRPRDEIVGHSQAELHPEGDAELYREAFERSVGRSGMISELPNGAQPQLRTADGGTVPVEINADTVQLPRGSVMYGVFRDISERKERERELELKERAMDEANVGITISDPDQEDNPLVYANDGFVEQTGYTRADAVGRNRRFLRADDSDQPALNDLRDAIAAEEATTVELRNYRKDGEQFWNRLSVTPVYDEQDRLTNYIGIQQDITQEKTREQRLEALYAATRSLLEAQTASEAFDVGSETLEDALGLAVANFYEPVDGALVRGPGGETELLDPPERVEPGSRPLWEAFESGNTVVYDDVETIDDDLDRGRLASAGYFPVGEHGVVAVGTTDPDRLDDAERRLVEMLTTNMASVLNTIERQRDLVEERERFRLLTESVDEYAFIIVDEDGTIQTWNDSAESLFGYDDDAALGMSMAELHLETDRESGLPDRLLQQAQVAGESAHEGWRVRADGSEFYADVRLAPLETDDGEFRGYARIVRDMTDRRRERRRTERFVEQSDDVVTIIDPDGTVTYASGSAERVLGYDPDDLLGENLFDYIHPDGREHALKMFYSCVDGNEDVAAECRLASPDRGWFNVEGHCRNMLDDEAIDGILVYLRDVTESKERARRFESIFNQTFQFTGLLDPDGAVIEANDAAVDFGGFERDDIVGEPFYDAPWWTHSDDVYDDIRNAIDRAADGEFVRYETEVRGADGLATIDFSVKPVTDDDEEVSMLVVEGRDITDQEQHRRHLNVMQRVMRHNMRNDLTKMRGWTQAMAEETDADARVEYLDTVDQVLDKWGEMMEKMKEIRTVLEFQKDQETRQEAAALVEDAVAPVREEHAGGTVVTDVPDTGLQVPATLRDAVRELVENAAEASAETTVEVELDRSADGWTKIVVRDDGPGMPEMEADVLETGEETPLNHGQGLGLWMVRMVVTQAGGDASVESTEDGTEVCLRVPASQTVGGQSIETTG